MIFMSVKYYLYSCALFKWNFRFENFVGVCPVLCSAHGHYGGGLCHCEEGYKGGECEIPAGECQNPSCSNHGRCIEGECHCERGFKGNDCSQRMYFNILRHFAIEFL